MTIAQAKAVLRPLWTSGGAGITDADLIAFAKEIERLRQIVAKKA